MHCGLSRIGLHLAMLSMLLAGPFLPSACAIPLVTYITGDTPADGQVIFRAVFDSAIPDSAVLTIAASESTPGLRLDNIDFVPGSGFSQVIVTAQTTTGNGALTRYNVVSGTEMADVISSTNAVAVPPPLGSSRPASIVPNPAGTHYYYNENQFGFAGATHRMMRVPVAGGAEEVVFNGTASGGMLVEFSGVEIESGRMYFFAHDTAGPAAERQLYSVALGPGGLALGGPTLEVSGLDRSSAGGPGPGSSDGSNELDFDPSSGLLYGTNISTGEVIGFDLSTGPPIGVGSLPFYIDPALITASAAVSTDVGLGLLSGVTTPGAAGSVRQIDGIRPDGAGHLVVVGHAGVLVSIDIAGILAGTDDSDIIRLFNRDLPTAGFTLGFGRRGIGFDDHTILAPAYILAIIPEPSSLLLTTLGFFVVALRARRNKY